MWWVWGIYNTDLFRKTLLDMYQLKLYKQGKAHDHEYLNSAVITEIHNNIHITKQAVNWSDARTER